MNRFRVVAACVTLTAVAGAAWGQVVLLKDASAKIVDCKAKERSLGAGSRVVGICEGPSHEISGLYFGDVDAGYVQWLTMRSLKDAGLTITDQGDVAAVNQDGTVIPIRDDSKEYNALEDAYKLHLNKTIIVPDDSVDGMS